MSISVNPNDCMSQVMGRFNEGLSQVRQWGDHVITNYAPSLDQMGRVIQKVALIVAEFALRFSFNYIGISAIAANPISAILIIPALIVINISISSHMRSLISRI